MSDVVGNLCKRGFALVAQITILGTGLTPTSRRRATPSINILAMVMRMALDAMMSAAIKGLDYKSTQQHVLTSTTHVYSAALGEEGDKDEDQGEEELWDQLLLVAHMLNGCNAEDLSARVHAVVELYNWLRGIVPFRISRSAYLSYPEPPLSVAQPQKDDDSQMQDHMQDCCNLSLKDWL